MNIWENIREALLSIRANLTRASLTILIIAFGITALIGVLTSIDGLKMWFTNSLSSLGSNTFRIQNRVNQINITGRGSKRVSYRPIRYRDAVKFKEKFQCDCVVSLSVRGTFAAVVKYGTQKTNPNVEFSGVDENYLITVNYKVAEGRSLTKEDIELARKVVVLGWDIKETLFGNSSPVGKTVSISGNHYQVIGYFEKMGSVGMNGGDKIAVAPITTVRSDFEEAQSNSVGISVYTKDPNNMPELITEATGVFRGIRLLKPSDPDNFTISKSDTFVKSLMENLQVLTVSATIIALITLFSAALGLMNIMLVSVTERTREIGVRKALGATRSNIMLQFLIEAIIITQLGGILGVLFGILIGNVVGILLESGFIFPVNWTLLGLALCFAVGLLSGLYPARKAAAVDPIISLRYE